MKQVVDAASDILGVQVKFAADCLGEDAAQLVNSPKPGEILLLENLRYYPQEKNGDAAFAKELSQWGDIYINDAFGTAHRAHASTAVIAQFFPKANALATCWLQK